ncbi:MAG: hypothetical protein V4615_03570 [Bacteroidota bacterium]
MEIPKSLVDSFELDETLLPDSNNNDEKFRAIRQLLIQRIEELLHRDIEKLKWILYRIDISEKKLFETLQNSDADAATVMADLIIERQIEKAESRKKFGGNENDWNFDV